MVDDRYLQIKQDCVNIPVDSSRLIYCPFCEALHERSLSVTRKASGIVFNCFRAKCGRSGFIHSVSHPARGVDRKVKEFNGYGGKIKPASRKNLAYIRDKYAIEESYLNHINENEQGFVMFPVFSIIMEIENSTALTQVVRMNRALSGWQQRRFDGIGKKAVLYPCTDGPYYQYYKLYRTAYDYKSPPVFYIVEDYISMLKVQMAIDKNNINGRAIALMGTHISDGMALWLSKNSSNVVFMLDNDATNKSIKYKNKYQLLWPNARVVMMQEDPKDTNIDILRSLI